MIDTEKYQPAQQNMKLVTRSLRSLATKLHILAREKSHDSKYSKYVSPKT
jgi:hypothetical protein